MKKALFISTLILICASLAYIAQSDDFVKTNDRLYINGNIISLENGPPSFEAMLVKNGKIVALGSNKELQESNPENIEIYDLKNQVVLPGFIDSHSHVAISSFFRGMVDLSGFKHDSNKEVWQHLSKQLATKKPGEWVVGKGIDSILVGDLELPTIQFLDKIAPENPIVLISQSIHTYWANSAAFKAVGISNETDSPSVSSYYGKNAQGELTGIIKEQQAFMPILDHLKKVLLTPQTLVDSTAKVFKDYAKNGNTTVVSAGITINDNKPLRLYEHLATEQTSLLNKILSMAGLLPKREPNPRHFLYIRHDRAFLLPEEKTSDDFYNILGIKHWHDGSPYTGSMYLKEPYKESDLSQIDLQISKAHTGEALISEKDLIAFITEYHNKGWQIAIHAQGDLSNESVLTAFEKSSLDFTNSRHRLEHSVLLPAKSMTQLKKLNLLPNFHINHLFYYGDALAKDLIGESRAQQILAIASAKKAGLLFSMHADQPMFESKPFRLIQTAIERKTKTGKVLGEKEKIELIDALKAMTINAAYMINMEDEIGSLKEGKYADFIIVDQDPFKIPTSDLENIKVLKTFVNGNEVRF